MRPAVDELPVSQPPRTALPRLLIVDDDRTTVRLLKTLLELDGFEVSISPRGADVIPLAQQVKPDLILMDYHLSDMQGIDVVVALRAMAEFATTPIVVASGLNVEREALEAGASKFLIKPFDPENLQTLFTSLIENTKA